MRNSFVWTSFPVVCVETEWFYGFRKTLILFLGKFIKWKFKRENFMRALKFPIKWMLCISEIVETRETRTLSRINRKCRVRVWIMGKGFHEHHEEIERDPAAIFKLRFFRVCLLRNIESLVFAGTQSAENFIRKRYGGMRTSPFNFAKELNSYFQRFGMEFWWTYFVKYMIFLLRPGT